LTATRKQRRWSRDPTAALRLLHGARTFDPASNTDAHLRTRASLERLLDGTGDTDDFNRVAIALNLAKVRALEIDPTLADAIEASQDAMTALRRRFERWGKWDATPAERECITYAIDANEVIVDASTPLQMERAARVVLDVHAKQREKS